MTLDEALTELRQRTEPVPKPPRLPTDAEVRSAEDRLGMKFHSDYRRFLMEASNVVYNLLEPAVITVPGAHNDLFQIAQSAWGNWQVPRSLLPICEDNADYYCMTADGRVLFWSHETRGVTGEEWRDLAAWIERVWMLDYDAA